MTTLKRDSMEATDAHLSNKLKATSLSAPSPTHKPHPHLANLLPNILKTIFSHLLDTELVNTGTSNVSYTHSLQPSGSLLFNASRSPFPVHTSLFYVNKTISEAARRYFYAQNLFIRFTVKTSDTRHAKTMLADSGVLFASAGTDVLEKVQGHAMDMLLVEKNSSQTRAVIIFPAQYLPRLVNFIDQATKATPSWASAHKLELKVQNTYGFPISRLQGDLLEPFRFLSNFSAVAISPEHLLPGYAEGLEKSMTGPPFAAKTWLDTVTTMAGHADASWEKKEWEVGRQQYHAVIIALTYSYLTHPEDLHSQDEAFAKAVQRLRWRCELGIGKIILAQYNLDRPHQQQESHPHSEPLTPASARHILTAETALSSALSLSTNSPSPIANPWLATLPIDLVPPNHESWFTDSDRGATWFQLGLAHAALKEFLFAAGDMERAVGLLVGGARKKEREEVEAVFEWVREMIDWDVRPGMGLKAAGKVARSGI